MTRKKAGNRLPRWARTVIWLIRTVATITGITAITLWAYYPRIAAFLLLCTGLLLGYAVREKLNADGEPDLPRGRDEPREAPGEQDADTRKPPPQQPGPRGVCEIDQTINDIPTCDGKYAGKATVSLLRNYTILVRSSRRYELTWKTFYEGAADLKGYIDPVYQGKIDACIGVNPAGIALAALLIDMGINANRETFGVVLTSKKKPRDILYSEIPPGDPGSSVLLVDSQWETGVSAGKIYDDLKKHDYSLDNIWYISLVACCRIAKRAFSKFEGEAKRPRNPKYLQGFLEKIGTPKDTEELYDGTLRVPHCVAYIARQKVRMPGGLY